MKGRNQLLVGFKGSFENMTVTQARDGDAIVKGKITTMTNPKTAAQLTHRAVFSRVVAQARIMKEFLNQNFEPSKVTRSAFNEFVGRNVKRIKESGVIPIELKEKLSEGDMNLDSKEMTFTRGTVYQPAFTEVSAPDNATDPNLWAIDVQWAFDANSNLYSDTDQLYILTVNAITGDYWANGLPITRAVGALNYETLPVAAEAQTVSLFFRDSSTGKVSTSEPLYFLKPDGTSEKLF